jgi:hypothetical protein
VTAMTIREPAVAIAIGRCIAARAFGFPKREVSGHERACGWEDYPLEVLTEAIREFNEWVGYNDRRHTTGRHETRLFNELHREEQRELVREAQAFEEAAPAPLDPEPAVAAALEDLFGGAKAELAADPFLSRVAVAEPESPAAEDLDDEPMPWFKRAQA